MRDPAYVELVTRLREIREDRGIQQKELAARLGVPMSTFGHWETMRHKPEPYWLARWTLGLDVRLGYTLTPVGDTEGAAQHITGRPRARARSGR